MSTELQYLARALLLATGITPRECFDLAAEFLAEAQRRAQPSAPDEHAASTESAPPLGVCDGWTHDCNAPHARGEMCPGWHPAVATAAAPRWGRADGTWHRWYPDSSEAVCGESGEWTPDGVRDEEHTCLDCRASETGEPVEDEPASTDYRGKPVDATQLALTPTSVTKPARKPPDRSCCVPGCSASGKAARNEYGAKVGRGVRLCSNHAGGSFTGDQLRAWRDARGAA